MALSRITEAVASFTDLTIGDDLTLTDDFLMASDASIIKFGADADVTLTHVHNTGLLLNSTSVIQFNDSSQNIGAPNATTLDINATDEIELNATLVDVNANLDVSGTYTGAGLMTTGGNIVIPDDGNIGSASDTDAIAISSGGVVTFSQNPVFPDGGIAIADLDIDGGTDIGAALADADLIIVDDGAGGTNRKATLSRLKTYIGASTAADDITAGDAAINLTTTSGNITIDAQGNDTDIIFKGTDGSSDTTFLTIDGSEAGAATFNNDVTAFSDKRLKENVQTIENGLDKVCQLRGVTYNRNDQENARKQIGVIAQEVEEVLPEVVLTADDEMKTKSVDYAKITAVLIEAIKELKQEIKELKAK